MYYAQQDDICVMLLLTNTIDIYSNVNKTFFAIFNTSIFIKKNNSNPHRTRETIDLNILLVQKGRVEDKIISDIYVVFYDGKRVMGGSIYYYDFFSF